MNISFKSLSTFSLRKKQKDGGVSLARTTRAWVTLLCSMCALLILSAAGAVYLFFVATDTARIVIIDPVDTVHYQSADINAALLRYDALRQHFVVPTLPQATSTPTREPVPTPAKSPVATSTPIRVE